MAGEGRAGKAPKSRLMRFYGPINDKPPSGEVGGLTWQGAAYTLNLHIKRDGSLTGCSSLVNHPTTPCSGMLVGETTRSITLNPHRGGQPVGALRIAERRKWQSRG